MPVHMCENCERVFKQKGHLESHKKRKNPCKKNDTIEKIVEKKVAEVLSKKTDTNGVIKIGTLFSGIGSIEHALDVMKIPHTIAFACDNDDYVKNSYFANYKITEDHWYKDVNILDGTKYLNDNIDLIVGGSPCQSFSTVGKQLGMDDERGLLIYQFIRIISEVRPKFFIFENVKGLTTHDKGNTFKTVFKAFEQRTGYTMCYSVLNSKDYGIPQSRQRLFVIGRRDDVDTDIVFPPPPIKLESTMKDFLQDNVDSKYALPLKGQDFVVKDYNVSKKYTQVNGDIALCQKKNQQFNWFGDFVFEPCKVDEKYTLSEKVQQYVLASGTKTFKTSTDTDLDIARPILSSVHKMHRAGIDNYITLENMRLRKLTPRECHRLMGFRDSYKIVVSDTRAYQQAGNSIVVDIFIHILQNIGFFNRLLN
jgi:DNA (cytosine-5)-methyltransferase 1